MAKVKGVSDGKAPAIKSKEVKSKPLIGEVVITKIPEQVHSVTANVSDFEYEPAPVDYEYIPAELTLDQKYQLLLDTFEYAIQRHCDVVLQQHYRKMAKII